MPDMSALKDLKDIHIPHPVSAWPPGPGILALSALFIVLLLCFIKHLSNRRKQAPKYEALAQLDTLEAAYNAHHETQETAAEITALLKRVALVYHPRDEVASLHGEAWFMFLKKTSRNSDLPEAEKSLIDAPFNPNTNETLTPLFSFARAWIKERRL